MTVDKIATGVASAKNNKNIDVWELGKNKSASDMWDSGIIIKNSHVIDSRYIINILATDVTRANTLTYMCEAMSETYNQIIDEQNEYSLEIDDGIDEIKKLQKDLDNKVNELENKRVELLATDKDDDAYEDNQKEAEKLGGEIGTLYGDTTTQIGDIRTNIGGVSEKAKSDRSKASIAKDYGETAVEKGTPLSQTQDKRKSFWRKLFGGWDKSAEREAGKKAVNAGNNLLEQVTTSSNIENEIKIKSNRSRLAS